MKQTRLCNKHISHKHTPMKNHINNETNNTKCIVFVHVFAFDKTVIRFFNKSIVVCSYMFIWPWHPNLLCYSKRFRTVKSSILL